MKTRHRPLFSVPDIRRRRLCITAAMAASGLLVGCAVSGFSAQGAKVGRRAYIVHGYGATPQDHWFPWLAAQLQQQGWQVKRIALPDAQAPDFTRWQAALADAIGTPVAGDIFIAHSLGTISLLHYLSNTRPARIGGLLLASGFAEKMPELGEINGFNVDEYVAQARLDLPAIAAMTPNIVSLVSDNDSIVAPRYSLKLAEALASRVIMIGNGGHLLAADGFVTLPEALQAVQAMR